MSIDDAPAAALPADYIIFPPFPAPPAGKRIVPFTEFKATGIQIAINPEPGYVELDGINVPTVTLRVKHSLTEMEQRKKRKGKKTVVGPSGQVRRLTWWEEWENEENQRTTAARVHADRVNRLHIACQDFKSSRHWPGPESGLPQLWEVWRLYVGIISSIQPPGQSKKNQPEPEPEDSDEGDDGDDNDNSTAKVVVTDAADAHRRRLEQENTERDRKEFDAQAEERYKKRQERKEANMTFFFDDPETFVKIFFSAHFRDKGFFVDNKNCRNLPILMEFFFRFILRNHVFPEYEDKLRKTLEICQQARIQLPATSTIGKALPGDFGKGCEKLMGQFSHSIFRAAVELSEDAEPDAKKRKLDNQEESDEFKTFKAAMSENLQFIDAMDPPVDHTAEARKDAIADNVDVNGVEVRPGPSLGSAVIGTIDSTTDAWGSASGASAWGPVPSGGAGAAATGSSGWSAPQESTTGGWGMSQDYDASGWGADPAAGMQWLDVPSNEVLALLGPTVLPLTHTTGIVMRSVRRIVKLVPPAAGAGKSKKHSSRPGVTRHPGEGAEAGFAASLAQVVTAPWVKVGNHIGSDIQPPQILLDSRGACVPVPEGRAAAAEDAAGAKPAPGAFDPTKDEFTWLVDMPVFDKLIEGMGVSGTWVQIARRDLSPEVAEKETAKDLAPQLDSWMRPQEQLRKGGPGKNAAPTKFWYLEQCHSVLASFHTDRYYPDQDN